VASSTRDQQARVLALAGAREPEPGEVRAYVVLDRRNRAATAAPTPTAVYVPAACPAVVREADGTTRQCGCARAIADTMRVLDCWTQTEHVISAIRNPCGHVEMHEALLAESERFDLERSA
jgi:hypothetical protein